MILSPFWDTNITVEIGVYKLEVFEWINNTYSSSFHTSLLAHIIIIIIIYFNT